MTAPPMWLPFGGAELRETAVAELEPHVQRLPGQLVQPRTRRATPSPPPHDDDGDEFDLRPPPSRVHELEEVPGEFRHVGDAVMSDDANSTRRMTVSLMAPSFLARWHANATDSRSSGPPRKMAAIWVPTFWSPWQFLAAVVSSLVDILVGSWKLAPTVHGASSSTLRLSSWQWCSRAPRRTWRAPVSCGRRRRRRAAAPAIGFVAGDNLTVPLRCACPSLPQVTVVVAAALDARHGMTCP
uniref:Uncharacterized protein n=1 Tax=Oryza glaberrima TaxID=4538 RepID=I1PC02_ORYGL